MILVLGFNVYLNEIEDVVVLYGKVLEVVVIGQVNDVFGELVKIYVVKCDLSLIKDEVIVYCCKYLIGYKVLKLVEFCDDLLKINVGKILCCVLCEENDVQLVVKVK